MKTLKSRVEKELKNCYLVTGDDIYLFEKAKKIIFNKCNFQMPDLNYIQYDDENFIVKDFLLNVEVFPMLDEKRLIVVNNVSKITESDKKILIEYFENPCESCVVLVLDYQNKFAFLKNFCENVDAKRFDKPILSKIVLNLVKAQNKNLSQEALDTLIEASGGYLSKIDKEIQKLAFLSNENLITKEMVEQVVSFELEYSVFELIDAVSKKQGDRSLKILKTLEKEAGVLAMICNHFRRLFFIAVSDLTNVELAKQLNVKEFAIVKGKSFIKSFSKSQLMKINKLLQEVDYLSKSGGMNSLNALYYLVFNILYI